MIQTTTTVAGRKGISLQSHEVKRDIFTIVTDGISRVYRSFIEVCGAAHF